MNIATTLETPSSSRPIVESGRIKLVLALSMILIMLTSIFFAGCGRIQFGSFAAVVAYIRGEAIILDEKTKIIDGVVPGSKAWAKFALTNNTGSDLVIVGANPSCSCTAVMDLPLLIAPLETKIIKVGIKVSDKVPNFFGSTRLYTNQPNRPEIMLRYNVRATTAKKQS